MLDKVYSTNNKRVVLLLLSFMLLVNCCLFGRFGVKSVSADVEVSFDSFVGNGYVLDSTIDSNCYGVLELIWGGSISESVDSSVNPFYEYGSNLTLSDVSFVSDTSCVSSGYISNDFVFKFLFNNPLIFGVGSESNLSWENVVEYGSYKTRLYFPSSFVGIVRSDNSVEYNSSFFWNNFDVSSVTLNSISYSVRGAFLAFSTDTGFISLYGISCSSYTAFDVRFLDRDLGVISRQSVKGGSYATIPTAPTYEGYDFIGWLPNVSGVSVSDPITCDVTFTATYSIKQYSVTLKDYDGTIISSSMVDYGNSFNTDYVPTRVGYTFVGYTSSSGYSFDSPVYEDIVLIANYEINRYSVVFKDYDGSIISSSLVDYGSRVVAPNTPTLVGHTFEGWSCSNSSYKVGSVVDCDLLFVANYSLNTYSISFYDYDDRLLNSVVVSFGYRISSGDIPNVSRVGYMFNGWDSSVDDFGVSDIVYCDVDFTANYSIITEFWNGYEYARDENYNNGYDEGYLSGKDDFYSSGYDDGYSSGYGVGFSEGENSALSSKDTFKSFMYSIIDAPFNVLSNAFSFEIFGINLSYFLISIVSLLLVAVVIRKLL